MTDINRDRFGYLCAHAKTNAGSNTEEDLLWELLVLLRIELGFDDPRNGILPFGSTRKEALWNNIFHLFNYNFRREPHFDLTQAINKELLSKAETAD